MPLIGAPSLAISRRLATRIGLDATEDPAGTPWEFRQQYAHAREAQGDIYADCVVDTAMDATIDPAVARVRIDALKWAAGKRKPKVYGDKVMTEHGGPGGGDIIIRAIIGGASAKDDG